VEEGNMPIGGILSHYVGNNLTLGSLDMPEEVWGEGDRCVTGLPTGRRTGGRGVLVG